MGISKKRMKISVIFDVLGYSLIGILSYIFGLFLQDYNLGNHYIFEAVKSFSSYGQLIIATMLFQIVLILSFGKIYASSILCINTKTIPYKIFNICIWILSFILTLVLFFLKYIYDGSFILFSFNVTILVGIYLLNYLIYKIKLNNEKNKHLKKTSRYVLVCPAILMVGVNIYYGSSIYDFIEGNNYNICIGVVFLLFFIFMYFFDSNKLLPYVLFVSVFLTIGLLALPTNSFFTDIILPMKNIFLAIAVAIFLSIFESWYIIFRQLNNIESDAHIKVTGWLITCMPPVVFLLFPIQDFNLIYIVTFCIGMMYADIKWIFYILPYVNLNDNISQDDFVVKKKNIAISRAVCGIFTLVFLMLDKYYGMSVPIWNEKYSIYNAGNLLTVVSIIISIVPMLWSTIKENVNLSKESLRKMFNKDINKFIFFRYLLYAVIPFVGHGLYGYLKADEPKSYFSINAMFVYMIVELLLILFKVKQQKREV